jgi:hypothetical protein
MTNIVLEQATKDYNPKFVSINEEMIEILPFDTTQIYFFFRKKGYIPIDNYQANISFILGFNSINYQHWTINLEKRFIRYENNGLVGSEAVFDGFYNLHQALFNGSLNIDFIQDGDLAKFFGNIPERRYRLEVIRENQNKMAQVMTILETDAANGLIDTNTARKLAELMPKSFSDPYLKKIQTALYEISELLTIKYPRLKTDLTVGAEYQLPKVLEAMGILQYSPEIKKKISIPILFTQNSLEESAIRAATIIACDKICKNQKIESSYLDRFLQENRKNFGNIKFHLTKTNMY